MNSFTEKPRIFIDIMISIIPAQNYVLNPFDLRAQIFRVDVVFSAYCRGQKIFRKVKNFTSFFDTARFGLLMTDKI